ncbi:hypothetical protein PRIC1_000524 [Phytophthora ramorum]|uniref:Uncharacterized protein n=1 Tax=Phytophthora ramorum TaxID=164328 RepID=H3GC57_PHYRM|nr:hypothetical protein KRP23_7197 [Phytophthora ramorum]KAH7498190.1 hypothetical protein KRP22_12306 [Phytophthora ramorum]
MASAGGGHVLAMGELLSDFESKQRGLLLMAIDKAVDKAMKKQSELLGAIQTQVEQRHLQAVDALRDDLSRTQPSLVQQLMQQTLDVANNAGLVNWIGDESKKSQALEYILKLRSHLEAGQGNAFRSDFEALLAVYMEHLQIPMTRGSRLNNRIEDLYEALFEKAGANDDLVNLVHRVRWACFGVRAIGNARSHDAALLSEGEILELCGCFSAIGAGMPTLALKFDVPVTPPLPSEFNLPMNGNSTVDMAMLAQLRQAAGSTSSDQTPFDFIIQLMTNNGFNVNAAASPPTFQGTQANRPSSLPPGFGNDSFSLSGQAPPLPPGPPGLNGSNNLSLSTASGLNLNGSNTLNLDSSSSLSLNGSSSLSSSGLNLSSLNLNGLNGLNGSSTQAPSLSRLGSIGSTSSNSSQQPPLPPGYNDNSGSVWSQPPLPPSTGSPQKILTQPPLPLGYESPQERSPHPLRAESPMKSSLQPPLPPSAESPQKRLMQPPSTCFAMKQNDVPTQAMLALVPTFMFYHDRPTELPKESDRVRKAMFARMLNHMDELPKATLCPLQPGHDPTCPLSHTYMEVMAYNPLYKRLICRQPSHYWGSQIQEDESCVCVHVDTGVVWDWMDEARDKRMYCARGSKCTNSKCIKSHSFEEMCWYNPSYKIKRCTVRAHDHIARARGTIAPPLDCAYYHIEEGKNADKREFTEEYDHVGKDIKMLFIERSHKPLAERLEALRYARANDL